MKTIKFRTPTRCQNGHFRWLYTTADGYHGNKQEWAERPCKCPTHKIGHGFGKCGEPEMLIGLSDVNGKEAYEGDTARYTTFDFEGVITCRAPCFIAVSEHSACSLQGYEFEIIGNRYE